MERSPSQTITESNAIQLGLLKLSDFVEYDVVMDEGERKEYVSKVALAIEWLRKELKFAEIAQLKHIGESAENWEQVLLARGTINACAILLKRFEDMNTEHQVNIRPKEEFDPHKIIAE